MKNKFTFLITCIVLAITIHATSVQAQLTGTFTIDKTGSASSTNYLTFSDAVSDLQYGTRTDGGPVNGPGVTGPVVINVVTGTGPYNEQIAIRAIAGTSATNTVTFNGNNNLLTFNTSASANKHVIRLDTTSYLIFDNMNIVTSHATYGFGFLIRSSEYITIKNSTIDVSAVTSTTASNSSGIIAVNSTTSATTATNALNNSSITNNIIKGGINGIRINGSTTDRASNNIITGNTIEDFYTNGIHLLNNNNAVISNNIITRGGRTGVGTFSGVQVENAGNNILIEKNKIHNSHGSATSQSGTAYGIYLNGTDALSGSENKIINNAIYNLNSLTGTIYGIFNSNADHSLIYHNSIVIDNALATSGTTRGFYQNGTATGVDFRNNIIYITRGGTGTKYAVYYDNTSTITSDNNILYLNAPAGTNNIGYFGADFGTLADWKTANNNSFDQNSLAVDPLFVDLSNYNYIPSNVLINNIGANLGVSDDINGVTRPANSDPGAYEFSPPSDDAGVFAILPNITPSSAGIQNIEVQIINSGLVNLLSANVYASIFDGTSTTVIGPVTFNGMLTPGSTSSPIVVGTYNFANFNYSYQIKSWTTLPNGIMDPNNSNDTAYAVACLGLPAGTYTLNSNIASGNLNFNSFNDLSSKLSCGGILGPITINVIDGDYNEQVVFNSISGVSTTNNITINGNGDTISYAVNATDRYVVAFNGAQYMTIDSLYIKSLDATYGYGILLTNGSDNITIKRSVIDVSSVTSTTAANSTGILSSGAFTLTSSIGNNASNLIIQYNTIIGGYNGIRLNGLSDGVGAANAVIENNLIKDFYFYGIYLNNVDNAIVNYNEITRPDRTSVTTFYGVYYNGFAKNTVTQNNRIHNPFGSAPTSTSGAYGVAFNNADAPAGSENKVINNVIYNMNALSGTVNALINTNSDGVYYYHNSVSLDYQGSTAGLTRGFYQTGAANNIKLNNNIFFITRSGTGDKQVLYFNDSTSVIETNYNDLYINSPSSTIAATGYFKTNFTTLADWKTANNNAFDQNSVQVNPFFSDASTGDLAPQNPAVNNIGLNVGVLTDILNVLRNVTNPDLGAYEFTPAPDDAGITAIVNPTNPISLGSNNIIVNLRNFGTTVLASVDIYAEVSDGTTQTVIGPFAFSGAVPLSGVTPVNIGAYNFTTGFYTIKAWTTNPNNVIDGNSNNDTLIVNLCTGLSGTYTINKNIASGGNNFISFNEVITSLNNCGISGPVVFNVTPGSGPYTESFVLGQYNGVSSTNTITFNGNNETIVHSPTVSAERTAIRLLGADHITIENFVLNVSAGTFGWGIQLMGQADSNKILNNTIISDTSSSSSNYSGIIVSGSSTSPTTANTAIVSGNTFSGNTIIGGYYGISLYGSSTNMVTNSIIENNIIKDFYLYGIYTLQASGTKISSNDISRPERVTTISTFNGIYLSTGTNGSLVQKNKIHDPFAGIVTSTSGSYGIYLSGADATAGSENRIINNLIYDFNSNGVLYGLYNSSSDGALFYHNSIVFDDQNSTATGVTRGFHQTTLASGIELKNNNIAITRSGPGIKIGLFFNTATSTIISNNNNIYVNAPGTTGIGSYSGTVAATLPIWQQANSAAYDQNSVSANPLFENAALDNYKPKSTLLNAAGANVGVTEDIIGVIRGSFPDIGAYEFTPPVNEVALISIILPADLACVGSTTDVKARIENVGSQTLSNIPVVAEITGMINTTLNTTVAGPIASGQSTVVSLGIINTSLAGAYNFKVYTNLSSDEDRNNDTLVISKNFTVSTAIAPVVLNDTICKGTSSTLSATAPASNVRWYPSQNGSSIIREGINFTTPVLSNNTTYYTSTFVPLSQDTITTLTTGTNSCQGGSMFNITPNKTIVIDSFAGIIVDTALHQSQVSVYVRQGGYEGYETDPTAWTFIGTTTVTSNGPGNLTKFSVGPIELPSGTTSGIFLNYYAGYTSGANTYINSDMTINTGLGLCGTFSGINNPRTWNGTIYYRTESCPSPRVAVEVIVAAPMVDAGSDQSVCIGSSATIGGTTTASGINAPFSILWNNAATLDNATAANPVATPLVTTSYIATVTDAKGCMNTDTVNVTVNALPDATITSANSICISSPAVNFTAATSGGTWSGTGITNTTSGTFDPAIAGVGTYTINYAVTDANGCSNTSSSTITVVPEPDASFTAPASLCLNGTPATLVPVTTGGTWSGIGVSASGVFNPTLAGVGSHKIYYEVSNGCIGKDSSTIVVNALPSAAITGPAQICIDATPVTFSPAVSGGLFTGTGITNPATGTFDPSVAGTGTFKVYYAVMSAGGCANLDSATIIVNALPNATITTVNPLCFDAAPVQLTAATTGGTWAGSGVNAAGLFDPSVSGDGTFTITYSVTDANSCSASATTNVTVYTEVVAASDSIVPTYNPAASNGAVYINVNGGTAPYTYNWSNGATTKDITGLIDGTYTVTVTDVNGCEEIESYVVPFIFGTGIQVSDLAKAVDIYPNPSKGSLNVHIKNGIQSEVSIEVFDMLGKQLFERSLISDGDHIENLELRNLASGSYMMRISINGESVNRKFIIAE